MMKRRDFIRRSALLAAGIASGIGSGKARAAAPTGGQYFPNRAPLQPAAFLRLPIGSIEPKGWLRHQLDLQINGLNGRLSEVSDFLDYDKCGWVHPEKGGWEELPYWLRGFGDLGYVTGDARVLALTHKWINGILATQEPDGWFGPRVLRTSLEGGPDFWPGMPLLNALRSFHEYTNDPRIIPFLTNYFRFQSTQPDAVFNRSWGALRWGDNIDSAYWLYNRTGEAWLLDLVRKMHHGSANYTDTIPNWHNVNLAQGFREPAQYGVLAHEPRFAAATYRDYDTIMTRYGQFPGGGFAGDENCRPGFGDPRQGFETCGIVEFMHSFQMLTRITGDPVWADRCEELAFNSMPAAFDPEQKVTHYITSANSVQLDNNVKNRKQFQNDFPMQAFKPGIHDYRCCPHNYGMGWPYYAEEMWLATADNGLCASLYGASEVRAKVGDGTEIHFAEETEYPFEETVRLRLTTPNTVTFPLSLRIPVWCDAPTLTINGKIVPHDAGNLTHLRIKRTWKNNDTVVLHLPMRTAVRTWKENKNAASVSHGPLTFSLAIAEKWNRYAGTERWPEYEVLPQSPWNYGLILDSKQPEHSFSLTRKPSKLDANPFTAATVPLELHARAKKIPGWAADSEQVVSVLQQSPILSTEPEETVRLIPMGAARLRITAFPTIGTGQDAHDWAKPEVTLSASCVHDTLEALNDGLHPARSYDQTIPRFTWWDHTGTSEWVQYDFRNVSTFNTVSLYWYDDTGHGLCRVPRSWRLLYKQGDTWKPVEGASPYGTALDAENQVTFPAIYTTGLRVEVQLQQGFSGGILEWRVVSPGKA